MRDRFSDEYDPEPDYDRPTRAEAEADAAEDEDPEQWGPDHEERTCIICDGLGHAYIIGWHEVPGKGTQPIIGGGPCPLEDSGRYDPRDDAEYDPF